MSKKTLKHEILGFFFYQLSVMTKSGITLVQAWYLILHEIKGKKTQKRLEIVAKEMESGVAPYIAMGKSGLFPDFACNIIKAGEHSGAIVTMLTLLSTYYEKSGKEKQNLLNAFLYPAFLIVCTIIMMVGAVIFILPVFEEMFNSMAVPMPGPTKALLSLRHIMRIQSVFVCPLLLCGIISVIYILRNDDFILSFEKVILKNNFLRKCCIAWCWQRFAQILAIQLAGGIPLIEALADANGAVPVRWFRVQMQAIKNRLETGVPLSVAIKEKNCSTPYIETMLIVSETTGNYEDSLLTVARYYQWMFGMMTKRMERLIEPIIMLIVGASVGFMVFSLLLPLLDSVSAMTTKI